MPNRIIREGVCSSDAIDGLTPAEEVLFYRLLTAVDDYGRFDGRAAIVKASCYPLKYTLSLKQIDAWLSALSRAGLILRYVVAGKPYILLHKFDQRLRAARSKYPAPAEQTMPCDSNPLTDDGHPPADDSNPPQVAASCARARSETHSESYSDTEADTETKPSRSALPDWLAADDWERWRKNRGPKFKDETARLHLRTLTKLRDEGHDPVAIIDLAIESGWAKFWPPRERDPPRGKFAPSLAERRTATIDKLTGQSNGRVISGTAERMDRAPIPALHIDVRQSDDDDVGQRESGRRAANMG